MVSGFSVQVSGDSVQNLNLRSFSWINAITRNLTPETHLW